VYSSGGFCSYTDVRLAEQLAGWVAEGIPRLKMKVGREPERDVERVRVAREGIGDEASCTSTQTERGPRRRRSASRRPMQPSVSPVSKPVSSNHRHKRLDEKSGLALIDPGA
jgi:hypothetical protein